ncbi:MAG: YdcH family protein [Kiloniellales bacterium]
MPTQDRVVSLKERHTNLEDLIKSEQSRPSPDENAIYELKREKLRIKDEIAALA